MTDKITERDFLNAYLKNERNDALTEYATERIAKLDERNSKRKNTPTKAQIENAGIKENILQVLTTGAKVAKDIATECGISPQKASALCRQLVDEGKLTATDYKVKGHDTVKQYSVVE